MTVHLLYLWLKAEVILKVYIDYPLISYHSENHFRTITISYHMQIDTLWPFHTISWHMQIDTIYDHFVPYADWHIWQFRTILKNTLWPFRTICRSTHYDHFVPYADRYIIIISYHMQIDTLWPFRTVCKILWR